MNFIAALSYPLACCFINFISASALPDNAANNAATINSFKNLILVFLYADSATLAVLLTTSIESGFPYTPFIKNLEYLICGFFTRCACIKWLGDGLYWAWHYFRNPGHVPGRNGLARNHGIILELGIAGQLIVLARLIANVVIVAGRLKAGCGVAGGIIAIMEEKYL